MKFVKRIGIFIIFPIFFMGYNVYAEGLPEKFDLREYINIEVRDQKDTNTCWAFSITSLLSTHLSYLENENYTFSPRHVEYTMAEDSIIGKENKYAYKTKKLNIGGNESVVKQYLVQGTGPVLEKNMPFENNIGPIYEEELPLDLAYKQVTEASHILPMYKEWVNGSLVYKDYNKNLLTAEDVLVYQNSVKNAIKDYGGVNVTITFNENAFNYLNGSFNTKEVTDYWHAVLLIGWDDNYSKENFNEAVRPLNDGAYIALNSWGNYLGDNGYIYISYEDVSIDLTMKTYIKSVEDVDYDNVYYNDLSLAKQNGEILTELTLVMDSRIVGYAHVNLKVDDKYVIKNALLDDCIENYVLETPVKLNNETEVSLEITVNDTFKQYIYPYYYTITNLNKFETGELSTSVLNKDNKEIYLYTKHNAIDNNKQVEVKVFKGEEDLTSKFNIEGNTIKSNQTGITVTPKEASEGEYVIKLMYKNQEEKYKFTVTNWTSSSSKPYEQNVKGDVSLDGKISALDLSQLKSYIIGLIEFEEKNKKACDINGDGNITVLDVSILKKMLVGDVEYST